MKTILIAAATFVSLLSALPASAGDPEHIKFHRKEGDSCSMMCGRQQCDDTSNTTWVCRAGKTAAKTDCVWHTTGVCTNNLPSGADINKNADLEKANREKLKAKNQKTMDDEKAAKDKAAKDKAAKDKADKEKKK